MLRFAVFLILLLGMFAFVPSYFAPGSILDVSMYVINECGDKVMVHGIYFDNVYFTLIYLILSYIGIALPFVVDLNTGLKRILKHASFMLGSWNFAGLTFEFVNFSDPLGVYNSSGDKTLYLQFAMTFTIGLAFIIAQNEWHKKTRLKN